MRQGDRGAPQKCVIAKTCQSQHRCLDGWMDGWVGELMDGLMG